MPELIQQLTEAFMDLDAAMTSLLAVASSPAILEEFHDHSPVIDEFLEVNGDIYL